MESNGIDDRFNVHSVLMLPYLLPREYGKLDRSREEPESSGFNKILMEKLMTVKATV
jgi:hypothetical protein